MTEPDIIEAVLKNNYILVKKQLECGLSVERRSTISGQTPLIIAVDNNRVDLVRLLLKHGANISTTDKEGWSALRKAVYHNHLEILKILLQNGG